MRTTRALLTLLSIFSGSYESFAQSAAPPSEFEVASVKPAKPGGRRGVWTDGSPNQIRMLGMSLKQLIDFGYGVRGYQVTGPDWIDSEKYDVVAKLPSEAAALPEEARWVAIHAITQALLAERFKLTLHRETKPLPVYALVVAKNGPKLEKAEGGGATTKNGRGLIEATNITMIRFAEVLSRQMDLPVVDRTGLEGAFNLKLEWVRESAKADSGPSVFTALQEQLGLRLESRKMPIEVLVIDRAERPSEN